jgi:hypothetical protein
MKSSSQGTNAPAASFPHAFLTSLGSEGFAIFFLLNLEINQ